MRLKLTLAYDGRAYRGWQSQTGGGAVQDVLGAALSRLAGQAVRLHAAGRTDAGVHARGQVAHCDVPDGRLDPADWQKAINAHLPADLRVMRCGKAAADFHARHHARGKHYIYTLWTGPVLPPERVGRAWQVRPSLDRGLLRTAARALEGQHDFTGFSANRGDGSPRSGVRTLFRVRVAERGPEVRLHFTGDGFLYKMVRMLAAWMVRVGQGREPVTACARYFAGARWPHVAPAGGLCLERVFYRRVITD